MICFLKRYENDIRLEENQKRVQTANPSICSVREYSNCQKTPEAIVTVNSYSAHRIVNLQYPFVEPGIPYITMNPETTPITAAPRSYISAGSGYAQPKAEPASLGLSGRSNLLSFLTVSFLVGLFIAAFNSLAKFVIPLKPSKANVR